MEMSWNKLLTMLILNIKKILLIFFVVFSSIHAKANNSKFDFSNTDYEIDKYQYEVISNGLFDIYADTLKIYLQHSHVPYLFANDESKILYPPSTQLSDIIKHKAISIDLNDDGVNEVIAYMEGSLVCGSGGCTSYILQEINGDWKRIGEFFPGHIFKTNKNHNNGFLKIYFNDSFEDKCLYQDNNYKCR